MAHSKLTIHPSADVQSIYIGAGTTIWQYVVVLPNARIGTDCNICSHCFIENDVEIGDRATVKAGVQIWDGISIGNDVFIGPNVSFANDKFPRSKKYLQQPLRTRICDGASIGAGATVLPGLVVQQNAMIGAGSVVTRSVPANAIVVGNPARIVGYVDTQKKSPSNPAISDLRPTTVPDKLPSGVELKKLVLVRDLRGNLTAGEFSKSIPFVPKRYFTVFGVPNEKVRGEHAHKKCEQFLVCVIGSCSVVTDDGTSRHEVTLDSPDLGLYVPAMVWGIQYRYSPDAVLLVFASDFYDPGDYIRDYSEFLNARENK